jgi:hypothetical protein
VHTLLPGLGPGAKEKHWKVRFEAQSPVEQLCQVGAGELLMPTSRVLAKTTGHRESLELASDLGRLFDVSLEAAVRNLVDLSERGCAMSVLQLMHKPADRVSSEQATLPGLDLPDPEKRLRVWYSWTSRVWDDRFFPPFKSVPEDSVAYAALQNAGSGDSVIFSATEDWTEVGRVGVCRLQAVGMPLLPQTVLCLISETA